MRLMSFAATTAQMRDRTKAVTRRLGFRFLKPGDRILACEKVRGVRREDRIELGVIVVGSVTRCRLPEITQEDVVLEGFPDMTPEAFVRLFLGLHGMRQADPWLVVVTRIAFTWEQDGTGRLAGSGGSCHARDDLTAGRG